MLLVKWIAVVLAALAVTVLVTLAGLVIFGAKTKPPPLTSVSEPMRHIDFSDLPAPLQFKARDGQSLSYRLYPGVGQDVAVLIQGSSGESSGMHAVAKKLAAIGDTVYVPDLRGHGHDGRKGDIDYIGQLDDDLADLAGVIRPLHQKAHFILVGHSSGGGFLLRIAVGPNAALFDRFVLVSPVMPYGAETLRPDVGGWAAPFTGRIVALSMLNKFGIVYFNGLPSIAFAVDPHASVPLDDTYSYRMLTNFGPPHDALPRLASVKRPLAVLIGARDELFYPDRYAPLIHRENANVPVSLVPDIDHMGMITDPRALAAIAAAVK